MFRRTCSVKATCPGGSPSASIATTWGRPQLVLEITEDALLADPDGARAVAHQLRDLGVVLSLDDFGFGFASLLQLRRIPLDAVKIDRALTSDLSSGPRIERFMRALELAVIVEGIERPAQADVLRRLHCTLVQGYLFGRPEPAPDLSGGIRTPAVGMGDPSPTQQLPAQRAVA
jgi:EAL domain-containing protein (putative c-di-GMP-specific phosphodiesterase class I)